MLLYLNHSLRGSPSGTDLKSLARQMNRLGTRCQVLYKEIDHCQTQLKLTGSQKLLVGGWFNRLLYLMPIPFLLSLDAWLMAEGLPRTRLELGLLDFSYNFVLIPLAVVVLELQCRAEFERERMADKAANLSVSRAIISFILASVMPVVLFSLFFTMRGGAPLFLRLLPLISWVGHLLLVFDPLMTQGLRSLRRRRDLWYYRVALWQRQRQLRRLLVRAESLYLNHRKAMQELRRGDHGLNAEGWKLMEILQSRP